jgi:hypothetical protein
MATAQMKRKQRRAVEGRRALIVAVALTGILLLAVFVTAGTYVSADRQNDASISKVTPLPASPGDEAAHRVASIVLGTQKQGRCEERRFDNRTGKIVSMNFVDCEARLAPERDTAASDSTNQERIRRILGAFRK